MRSGMDLKSIEVILDWALCHKRKAIIADLLPVYSNKEGENNIILEGRLAVFIVRDLAENLKYENFEDILLLLENLISLESNYLEFIKGMNQTEWSYWKREIVVQGAVSILHRTVSLQDRNSVRSSVYKGSLQDLNIPRNVDANKYILDILEHFETHKDCYQGENNQTTGENEELRKSHLRLFTDATQSTNSKMSLNREKVLYLLRNNAWQLKKAFFLKFLEKFERAVFPTNPVLSIEYLNETSDNTEDNEESSAAHLLHEVAEASWENQDSLQLDNYSAQIVRKKEILFDLQRKFNQPDSLCQENSSGSISFQTIESSLLNVSPFLQGLRNNSQLPLKSSSKKSIKSQLVDKFVSSNSNHELEIINSPPLEIEESLQSADSRLLHTEESCGISKDKLIAADSSHLEVDKLAENSGQKKRGKKRKSLEDSEILSDTKPFQPRHRWTMEEQVALEEGIKKYGTGRWKEILDDPVFGPPLLYRTNINLKDRYRVMEKHGWSVTGPSYLFSMK